MNPYRDKGNIDLNNEFDLTNTRLAGLLQTYKDESPHAEFMEGYRFESLVFKHNPGYIRRKYTYTNPSTNTEELFNPDLNPENIFHAYIRAYGLRDLSESDSPALSEAYRYLIYKTNSISQKYPSYRGCIEITHITQFNDPCLEPQCNEIRSLVAQIQADPSHITLKIKQCLRFIGYCETHSHIGSQIREDYLASPANHPGLSRLDNTIASFPPPFYYPEISFSKESSPEDEIPFNKMSSGERQFLFSVSSILYHIKNIISVPDNPDWVPYKHINLILDEIELYFHPEYQRTFIGKLLGIITRLRLNESAHLNILIATHSPFILSDIPACNILYLEDGEPVNEQVTVTPFGANIHDILCQSFFLKNGFTGEFAKTKINGIINTLNRVRTAREAYSDHHLSADEFATCQRMISLIGEPLIRNKLTEMLSDVYCNPEVLVRQRIDELEANLNQARQELVQITRQHRQ